MPGVRTTAGKLRRSVASTRPVRPKLIDCVFCKTRHEADGRPGWHAPQKVR